MIRSALRWLLSSIALLFVVTALTFVLVSLAPGDAARAILSSQSSTYTPEQYQAMRHALGIDQPLAVQYGHWLDNLVHGSLGTDLFSGQSVAEALRDRIGPSLSIILGTVVLSGLLGTWLGIVSARRGGLPGRIVDVVSLVGFAVPNFWLALLLVELARDPAGLVPHRRLRPAHPGPGRLAAERSCCRWSRCPRPASRSSPNRPGTRCPRRCPPSTSRCCGPAGCRERAIVYKHALRNAAIPVVTLLGLLLISLLSGAVVIESFFSVPGLGAQAVEASGSHNLPVITGVALLLHGRRGGREPAGGPLLPLAQPAGAGAR